MWMEAFELSEEMFESIRKKVVKLGGYVTMIKNSDYLPYVEEVFTINNQLKKYLEACSAVIQIRVKGLMIGIGLDENIIDCTQLLQKALEDELLINITGNSIRMLPPLIITQEEADILIKKIIKLINA